MNPVARWIDSAIATVSPLRGLRRSMLREQLKQRSSPLYAAAKTTRLTGAWSLVSHDVNTIIGASSPAVRARVRQLIRDFPYLARAANILVDYSVGTGITYQNATHSLDGELNRKVIRQIEDAVRWWMDEADIAGKLHYNEMMRLAKRQDVEAGEFLIVKSYPKNRNQYLPYALQMYEADWLTSAHDTYLSQHNDAGTTTRQGIEYETATGRVIGYWFKDPVHGGRDQYVAAKDVVHGFQTLRPQQLRGISPFAPGVLLATDLADYMDAEIDGAKMASKYLAFVTSNNPGLRQDLLTMTEATNDGQTKKIEELENAIIEYLNPGEEVEMASSNRPGNTFTPFVRLLLTMLAVTTGAPYELLSGDYQGMNFATMRIARNDFTQQLRPICTRHIMQFGMPTVITAIDMAVMTGKISLPGYWQNRRRYHACEWQPPGMDAVDPLREAKSQIEAITFGLQSPQEVARARGKDLENIYAEILAAKKLAEEYGLAFDVARTNQKSNPAAITGE